MVGVCICGVGCIDFEWVEWVGGYGVVVFFFLMIRRPPRSTQGGSSAASDVYKGQLGGR